MALDFLLQVLAKKRPQSQTPAEWRKQVEQRLEPTPLALCNYGGGRLPVVKQMRTHIGRPGHKVEALVQVQKNAPAKLLIGTDVLPRLGFLFVRTEMVLICWKSRLAQISQSLRNRRARPKTEGAAEATVCLLQAVRVPGHHSKFVRVKADRKVGLSYFEPSAVLEEKGVKMPEAAVEPDCILVVVENHITYAKW